MSGSTEINRLREAFAATGGLGIDEHGTRSPLAKNAPFPLDDIYKLYICSHKDASSQQGSMTVYYDISSMATQSAFAGKAYKAVVERMRLDRRLAKMETELRELSSKLEEFKSNQAVPCQPFILPITTFAPEPYRLLQPINVVIQPDCDGFIVTCLGD